MPLERISAVSVVALLLVGSSIGTPAQDRPLPDYDSFAAQVKKHLATDEERQSGYMFIERRTEQKLDGDGRVRNESVKVFEVYPGLPGEDRYRRLIEEDGKPLPPQKLAERDRDRQKEVESYAQKMSNATDRAKEEQQRDKKRRRYTRGDRRSVPHLRHSHGAARTDRRPRHDSCHADTASRR